MLCTSYNDVHSTHEMVVSDVNIPASVPPQTMTEYRHIGQLY